MPQRDNNDIGQAIGYESTPSKICPTFEGKYPLNGVDYFLHTSQCESELKDHEKLNCRNYVLRWHANSSSISKRSVGTEILDAWKSYGQPQS